MSAKFQVSVFGELAILYEHAGTALISEHMHWHTHLDGFSWQGERVHYAFFSAIFTKGTRWMGGLFVILRPFQQYYSHIRTMGG